MEIVQGPESGYDSDCPAAPRPQQGYFGNYAGAKIQPITDEVFRRDLEEEEVKRAICEVDRVICKNIHFQ